MAYKINEDCTGCGLCEPECPVQAITAGDPIYTVDFSKCVECVGHFDEPQCVAVCPVAACIPDPEHPKK